MQNFNYALTHALLLMKKNLTARADAINYGFSQRRCSPPQRGAQEHPVVPRHRAGGCPRSLCMGRADKPHPGDLGVGSGVCRANISMRATCS